MNDAVEETAVEAVKQQGLQRYIWVYLVLVPVAATTASAVAIGIAALQGLSSHEAAPQLYATVVMLSVKLIFSIALAYVITLGIAAVVGGWMARRRLSIRADIQEIQKAINRSELEPDHAHFLRTHANWSLKRVERRRTLMLSITVLYGAAIFLATVYLLMMRDIQAALSILQLIARGAALADIQESIDRFMRLNNELQLLELLGIGGR